jgi:hypothetical protein
VRTASRILLGFAALILVAGGVAHTRAFWGAVPVIDAARLPPFFNGSFKALWLNDSVSLFGFALLLGYIAARPTTTARTLSLLIALPLIGYALSMYATVGSFFAAHLLLAAGLACVLAALPSERILEPR